MADSSGRSLPFGRALVASLLLSRQIRARAPRETNIGVLLPSSVGGALANVRASFAGKAAVNLNFTAGREAMASAVDRCGIKTILTSRLFLSKADLTPMDGMVFLEDLLGQMGAAARLRTLVTARLLPAWALQRLFVHAPTRIRSPPSSSRAEARVFQRG